MNRSHIFAAIIFLTISNAAHAQYNTLSNGDANIYPGGVYCYSGGSIVVEKGRSGETADIRLHPGAGCAGVPQGKLYIESSARINGNFQADNNIYVKKKIYAAQVEITNSVPSADYVFQDDYHLRSLDDVEKYVAEHKHLPNVPSAAEFKAKGYDIGQMDNVLLEKVEELTLYIIAQEKRIKELESRLND